MDGEIDLSTCYDVTEYPVQRNYGFQIHVSPGVESGDRLGAEVGGHRLDWPGCIFEHLMSWSGHWWADPTSFAWSRGALFP